MKQTDNDETVDDLLDRLPGHLRRKVIEVAWMESEEAPESAPTAYERPYVPAPTTSPIDYILPLILGLPLAALGLFLTATVVFAFAGIPLLLLSGCPLGAEISRRQKRQVEWEERQRDYDNRQASR